MPAEPAYLPLVGPPDDGAQNAGPLQTSTTEKDDSILETESSSAPNVPQPPVPESAMAVPGENGGALVDASSTGASSAVVDDESFTLHDSHVREDDVNHYNKRMLDGSHHEGDAVVPAPANNFPQFVEATDDHFDGEEEDTALDHEQAVHHDTAGVSSVDTTAERVRPLHRDGTRSTTEVRQHIIHVTIEAPEDEVTHVDLPVADTTLKAGEQAGLSQQPGSAIPPSDLVHGSEPSLDDNDQTVSYEEQEDVMEQHDDMGSTGPATNGAAFDVDPVKEFREGAGALRVAVEEQILTSSASPTGAPYSEDGASDLASQDNIASTPEPSSVLERIVQSAQAAGLSIDKATAVPSSRFFLPPFRAAACYPETKLPHCHSHVE